VAQLAPAIPAARDAVQSSLNLGQRLPFGHHPPRQPGYALIAGTGWRGRGYLARPRRGQIRRVGRQRLVVGNRQRRHLVEGATPARLELAPTPRQVAGAPGGGSAPSARRVAGASGR
jgi:hypothetical protein